jgi:hypothetical protein
LATWLASHTALSGSVLAARMARMETRLRGVGSSACVNTGDRPRGDQLLGAVLATYCDAQVANREIRVWHLVIEKGY